MELEWDIDSETLSVVEMNEVSDMDSEVEFQLLEQASSDDDLPRANDDHGISSRVLQVMNEHYWEIENRDDMLHFYYAAKVCRRHGFSKELTITLLGWLDWPPPPSFLEDGPPTWHLFGGKGATFFGSWNCDYGQPIWDDMLVTRVSRQAQHGRYTLLASTRLFGFFHTELGIPGETYW